jgi:hypothetical protein
MRYVKTLGLLAVAAAALMAFAGTASATALTSPAGTTYTGAVRATSSSTSLHGPFITVSCTHSTAEGKVEAHGASVTAAGKVSGLTFTGCNYPVTVKKAGALEVHSGSPSRVTSSGAEVAIHTSVGECVFSTVNTAIDIGQFTGGTPARHDIDSVTIPRTGGSFFCGTAGEWTGSYTITTPGTLLLD